MRILIPAGKFPRFALGVAGLLILAQTLVISSKSSPDTRHLLSNVLQAVIVTWACYCCFEVTLRSSRYLRQLWMLLAGGLSLCAAAQWLGTFYQSVIHAPAGMPWPSDILFVLWVTPTVLMLFPQPPEEVRGISWPLVLDFAQLSLVALTAYLYFFYVPAKWEAEGQGVVLQIMRLQMFRDATLGAAFVIRAATVSARPLRGFFARMAALFFISIGSDFIHLLGPSTYPGTTSWADITWCSPFLFAVGIAATWKSQALPKDNEPRSRLRMTMVSQALPIGIPLLVLFMGRRIAAEQMTLAWVAITGSFLLSAARMILINESQRHITGELLETQQARLRSEQMFSTAFRLSPDPVGISLVPENRFVEVNDSFTRFTGYRREEALGRSGEELNLWVDAAHRAKVMARLREQGEVRDEEFQCRTKSREIRTGYFSGALIELEGRMYALVVIRDVSARKQAEEALRASEERFRTLVENLHVAIVLIGPRQEIQFANQASLEMFGMTEAGVLGKRVSDLGLIALNENGTEMAPAMRPGNRALATGKIVRNEVMGWRREGSKEVLWILGEAVPLLAPDGKPDRVIASFSDITKRKEAEEALHQLSTRLLQLQDEERRRVGRELHDSLAQSVLSVNLELAQVARSEVPLDERTIHALSEARRVLREMSREIRTMSYLLHPPVLDELGLASAVQEYVQGFRERSGIALELEIGAGFARLTQEAETALFRIVQESLSNIQKHSGSKTGRISLREESGYVELEVRDEGSGMQQVKIARGGGDGARLGVGILGMRERMAQLGGRLEVESNTSGTTVRATIPVRLEVSNADSHPRGR
jgi:PAS domain S-box-containing protein